MDVAHNGNFHDFYLRGCMTRYVADFYHLRPAHELSQEAILRWIASAHSYAQSRIQKENNPDWERSILELLLRIGSGPGKIEKRGFHFSDMTHQSWDKMQIYNLLASPEGNAHRTRTAYFAKASSEIAQQLYVQENALPAHLIHVTCTGYAAPSAAQKLVAQRESATAVTHAYHMGCYASLPAIRIALGLPSSVGVLHTELCSLHMNPLNHDKQQLVIQTLFGDGFIRYSVLDEEEAKKHPACLKVLHIAEKVIPNTHDCMQWGCADWGMEMILSPDVPRHIGQALPQFLELLAAKSGYSAEELKKKALFAIHPGGPKIIDAVEQWLKLSPEQSQCSREVLRTMGNMSSATLPHIWEKMVRNPSIEEGTPIVSFAFGPGLTLFGSVFERVGGIA